MDNFDKWTIYSEKLRRLRDLKEQLNETVKEAAKVNTKYQNYLSANPYKKKKKELNNKVKILREELMKEIPDKGYNFS